MPIVRSFLPAALLLHATSASAVELDVSLGGNSNFSGLYPGAWEPPTYRGFDLDAAAVLGLGGGFSGVAGLDFMQLNHTYPVQVPSSSEPTAGPMRLEIENAWNFYSLGLGPRYEVTHDAFSFFVDAALIGSIWRSSFSAPNAPATRSLSQPKTRATFGGRMSIGGAYALGQTFRVFFAVRFWELYLDRKPNAPFGEADLRLPGLTAGLAVLLDRMGGSP
jgi:hypothetical protein